MAVEVLARIPGPASTTAAPRTLVLVAHGTRRSSAVPLLERTAGRVGELLPGTEVRHGWVEFQRPSAAEALAGDADPVVVPFFLGGGYHVEHDLPRLMSEHGSGTITARHFTNGQPGEEASAGLLLASMDQVVEDVLLGVIDADDVPGAVKSSEIQAPRAMRWFGRGLRRPPQ